MKAGLFGLLLTFAASQTFAQSNQLERSSATQLEGTVAGKPAAGPATAAGPVISPAISPALLEKTKQAKADVIEKKHFTVSGPLVRPFKARKIREVPRHLLHAINPFAAHDEESDLKGLPRVSTRAWTTTVGWNPGTSSFADPVTHESSMNLVSFSKHEQ